MYTCQCEGLQMGQSSGVLFQEAFVFQRCPLVEVLPYYWFACRSACCVHM